MLKKAPPADISAHLAGVPKGEERVREHGREAGRENEKLGRTARDSTSINPAAHGPIDPRMPHMPPA